MIKMIIDKDGDEVWYDSSIKEYGEGGELYSSNLHWHRIDGPAVTYAYNDFGIGYEWWVNDKKCRTFKEFQEEAKLTDDQMCILRLKYGEI
jgi:hypothetical protein